MILPREHLFKVRSVSGDPSQFHFLHSLPLKIQFKSHFSRLHVYVFLLRPLTRISTNYRKIFIVRDFPYMTQNLLLESQREPKIFLRIKDKTTFLSNFRLKIHFE